MENKEIGFNTRCENLKQALVNTINQSNLPISVIFYIAKSHRQCYNNLNKAVRHVQKLDIQA